MPKNVGRRHTDDDDAHIARRQRVDPRARLRPDLPMHCLRCHREFTRNEANSCVIPHVFETASRYRATTSTGVDDYFYVSACCGGQTELIEHGIGDLNFDNIGSCFRGHHTTSQFEIMQQYNGVNILRCKHDRNGNCVHKVLGYQKKRPVFGGTYDRNP